MAHGTIQNLGFSSTPDYLLVHVQPSPRASPSLGVVFKKRRNGIRFQMEASNQTKLFQHAVADFTVEKK